MTNESIISFINVKTALAKKNKFTDFYAFCNSFDKKFPHIQKFIWLPPINIQESSRYVVVIIILFTSHLETMLFFIRSGLKWNIFVEYTLLTELTKIPKPPIPKIFNFKYIY